MTTETKKAGPPTAARTARAALALGLALAGAVAVASAAPDRSEKKATSRLKLAQSLYQAGRYGEALGQVDGSLDADGRYVPAHQLRGQILVSLDRLDDALREFDRALALDRKYTEARNWKGYVLVQLKRYDEAMQEYAEALKDLTYATPEVIHLNIGKLHRLQGRHDQALESLRKSVSLNPSFARGYLEMGITYEQMGRSPEALKSYQDARVGLDDSADLNLRLGRLLLTTGRPAEARKHFQKVIHIAPDGPEAAQARAEIARLEKQQPS